MDSLATVLRSLKLASTVLSRAVLRGSWGVSTLGASGVLFHGIVTGRAWVARAAARADVHSLGPGDIALLPLGDPHVLLSAPDIHPVPIQSLGVRAGARPSPPTLEHGTRGEETRIVCGLVHLDHPAAAGLVAHLPELVVATPDSDARRAWALSALALLEEEIEAEGNGPRVRSLADSLFVHTLVSGARTSGLRASGLFAAARDDQIGRALALVHSDPKEDWSVAALAERVGMSRTLFCERFAELVGESPARYVARWRVQTAADLLRDRTLSTAEIAERVGYSSEDALAKAFRRHLGTTPGQWRRERVDNLA